MATLVYKVKAFSVTIMLPYYVVLIADLFNLWPLDSLYLEQFG
jgi:hypothetical protein